MGRHTFIQLKFRLRTMNQTDAYKVTTGIPSSKTISPIDAVTISNSVMDLMDYNTEWVLRNERTKLSCNCAQNVIIGLWVRNRSIKKLYFHTEHLFLNFFYMWDVEKKNLMFRNQFCFAGSYFIYCFYTMTKITHELMNKILWNTNSILSNVWLKQ